MSYDFNTTYASDPWDGIESNERDWYDGILRERYSRQAVYSPLVTMKVDLNAHRARTIHFNELLPPRPNTSVIPNREMNASRLYMDGYQKKLTVQRYGNGMSLHRESEMFNYWSRNGDFGLIPIIQDSLGQAIVDHIDLLARNAFFTNPYSMMGTGSATGFSGITNAMKMNSDLIDAIRLGMKDRRVPWASLPVEFGAPSEIVCITSPGALYDLFREGSDPDDRRNTFVQANLYQEHTRLLIGEVGQYKGVRFVENNLSVLWNCGETEVQTPIKSAVVPGQGAPDPSTTAVDEVRYVGQADATHYIEVADASGFAADDKVTIHKLRHTAPTLVTAGGRGVLNGPRYDDPMLQDIEIHSVDTVSTPNRLILKEPYMMVGLDGNGLETDLGGTVFGYVTLGRNIHTALFLNPNQKNGIIAGVTQPPNLYFPPPVDDFMSIYRITYDMWLKYALWEPQVFEVAFLAGSNKGKGQPYIR